MSRLILKRLILMLSLAGGRRIWTRACCWIGLYLIGGKDPGWRHPAEVSGSRSCRPNSAGKLPANETFTLGGRYPELTTTKSPEPRPCAGTDFAEFNVRFSASALPPEPRLNRV